MKTRPVKPGELAELLRGVLARVDAGEMDMSVTTGARIEGALVACEVLAGGSADMIVERLTAD